MEATRDILRRKFWTTLLARAKTKTDLHAGVSSNDSGWIAAGAGTGGLGYVYVVGKHELERAIIHRPRQEQPGRDQSHLRQLEGKPAGDRTAIRRAALWEALEGKQAKRIAKYFELGGYRDDEAKWPEIQDAMIDAMIRLDRALCPYITKLKAGA